MWDYDYLREMSKGIPEIVSYGTTDASVTGIADSGSGDKTHLRVKFTYGINIDFIQTQLTGIYNLPNVLAAVTVGNFFKTDPVKINRDRRIPALQQPFPAFENGKQYDCTGCLQCQSFQHESSQSKILPASLVKIKYWYWAPWRNWAPPAYGAQRHTKTDCSISLEGSDAGRGRFFKNPTPIPSLRNSG